MRFSAGSILALPVLAAAAQDGPIEQFQAQAQYWIDFIGSYIPSPNKAHSPEPPTSPLNILTLHNWGKVLRGSAAPTSIKPEEWWILVTGGNKTCWGRCDGIEKAFNETAALWSTNIDAPHLGYVDCDNQPVLCNAWGTSPPCLWWVDIPTTGPVDIRTRSLNVTTTTPQTFVDHWESQDYKKLPAYEGWFHPFNGQLAQLGLAVPFGYIFWFLAVVPSWLFMIGISFVSRTIMNRRAAAPQGPRRAAAPAAPASRAAPAARARVGAPPGDGGRW